jgi:hypothetical protein
MPDLLETAPEPVSTPAPVESPVRWRLATRIAFRFWATFFAFFVLSTQMNVVPGPSLSDIHSSVEHARHLGRDSTLWLQRAARRLQWQRRQAV